MKINNLLLVFLSQDRHWKSSKETKIIIEKPSKYFVARPKESYNHVRFVRKTLS